MKKPCILISNKRQPAVREQPKKVAAAADTDSPKIILYCQAGCRLLVFPSRPQSIFKKEIQAIVLKKDLEEGRTWAKKKQSFSKRIQTKRKWDCNLEGKRSSDIHIIILGRNPRTHLCQEQYKMKYLTFLNKASALAVVSFYLWARSVFVFQKLKAAFLSVYVLTPVISRVSAVCMRERRWKERGAQAWIYGSQVGGPTQCCTSILYLWPGSNELSSFNHEHDIPDRHLPFFYEPC